MFASCNLHPNSNERAELLSNPVASISFRFVRSKRISRAQTHLQLPTDDPAPDSVTVAASWLTTVLGPQSLPPVFEGLLPTWLPKTIRDIKHRVGQKSLHENFARWRISDRATALSALIWPYFNLIINNCLRCD